MISHIDENYRLLVGRNGERVLLFVNKKYDPSKQRD